MIQHMVDSIALVWRYTPLAVVGLAILFMYLFGIFIWGLCGLTRTYLEDYKKYRAKKKEEQLQSSKKKTEQSKQKGNVYLEAYYRALEAKDREAMIAALVSCKEHCSAANSYCLDEMFCPECPFGGLPVMSGRTGL